MAKKRTSKRKTGGRRRRRVSGIGDTLTPMLGGLAGVIASNFVNKALTNSLKLDPKFSGLGTVAVAMFLPKFIKGPLGAGLAVGMGASGLNTTLKGFGVSIGSVADFYRVPTINGMRKVSGSARQALAGVDLAENSADVRRYHNFATGTNSMQVISGVPSEYDETSYGL